MEACRRLNCMGHVAQVYQVPLAVLGVREGPLPPLKIDVLPEGAEYLTNTHGFCQLDQQGALRSLTQPRINTI